MILKTITYGDSDMAKVKDLYDEAFPPSERFCTVDDMLVLTGRYAHEAIGIYRDEAPDDFVGMFIMQHEGSFEYLPFFAICAQCRSMGVGGAAIRTLAEQCGDLPLVLEIESIYEECDNLEQRERRLAFYLRNGFHDTGWMLRENGVDFMIASTKEGFEVENLRTLLNEMEGLLPNQEYIPEPFRHA